MFAHEEGGVAGARGTGDSAAAARAPQPARTPSVQSDWYPLPETGARTRSTVEIGPRTTGPGVGGADPRGGATAPGAACTEGRPSVRRMRTTAMAKVAPIHVRRGREARPVAALGTFLRVPTISRTGGSAHAVAMDGVGLGSHRPLFRPVVQKGHTAIHPWNAQPFAGGPRNYPPGGATSRANRFQ